MKAMVLQKPGMPLQEMAIPRHKPGDHQVLLRVRACAVCRTDLHVVDGELTHPKLPIVPGHEIVGIVEKLGDGVNRLQIG
ncbi:MAG: alcohol dehydrogenase catalytic domain-containing protein, partial [Bdellovibrionales bacterium]